MKYLNFALATLLTLSLLNGQELNKWSGYWERPVPTEKSLTQPVSTLNLLKSSGLVWIRIYQIGISSQDLPACVFHPSCSRFAMQAIQKYGIVKGILLSSDRLLRCNPFAYQYYPFDGEKFSDPVEKYDQ